MAEFCPLFSGSTANCTYIGGTFGGILVDVGCSFRSLKTECEAKNIDLSAVKAILITHSHSDHVKGLKTTLKNLKVPVIASAETLASLIEDNIFPEGALPFEIGGEAADINGVEVRFFSTSHDAVGSGGYTFILPNEYKISVCTDLGIVTDGVRNAISGSNLVMLESNHDLKMLKSGPYPPELKMRIMSDMGHLSNIAASAELKALLKGGANRFVLAHLSKENNLPHLAASAARASLLDLCAKENEDYILKVASPKNNGVIYL